MSSPGTPVRIAKYLGTVLLVAVAVVLMIFGVGAILDRLDPGEPLSQGQIDQAIQQPPHKPASTSTGACHDPNTRPHRDPR